MFSQHITSLLNHSQKSPISLHCSDEQCLPRRSVSFLVQTYRPFKHAYQSGIYYKAQLVGGGQSGFSTIEILSQWDINKLINQIQTINIIGVCHEQFQNYAYEGNRI